MKTADAVEQIEYESLADRSRRVLSRFSVFDLTEQAFDDLARAETRLASATKPVVVTESGISLNLISWFTVKSGTHLHNVRRFENFCYCDCEDYYFNGAKACRHIAATFAPVCVKCRAKEVATRGEKCLACEMDTSPYLKTGTGKRPETIGNFRI